MHVCIVLVINDWWLLQIYVIYFSCFHHIYAIIRHYYSIIHILAEKNGVFSQFNAMDEKILLQVCDYHDPLRLGDDFVIIDSPNLKVLEGRLLRSTCYLILHCTKGAMQLMIGMYEQTILEGTVIYLMMGQMYKVISVSETFEASVVALSDNFLKWMDLKSNLFYQNNSGKAIQSSSHGSFTKYIGICRDIIQFDMNSDKKEVIQLLTKGYLIGFSHFGEPLIEDTLSNDASSRITQQFMALLQEKPFHRSVDYYAGALHITAKHLYFAIRKGTGHGVLYWINQATITEAGYLLSETRHSVLS